MRALCAAALIFMLMGCETAAQREADRIITLAQEGMKQSAACHAPIEHNPRYARIYAKFGVGEELPTRAQLADRETITDDDVALGFDWYAEFERCERADIERLGRIDPQLGIWATNVIRVKTQLVAEIANSRPSYREINQKILTLREAERAAGRTWGYGLANRLRAAHQQELAEREQEQQAFMAEVGAVTEGVAKVLLASVALLAEQQALLGRAQAHYATTHPTYVPARQITQTRCDYVPPVTLGNLPPIQMEGLAGGFHCTTY